MPTRRYLVIANQTLAEVELTEAIRERLEAGPSSSTCSFPTLMLAISPPGSPEAPPCARHRRRHRRYAGHRARPTPTGPAPRGPARSGRRRRRHLGDADQIKAVTELLERQQFDEIILSTLPQPISRWLGMDLPHRLHRQTGLPVTTITSRRVI
jgi:hypothetical protein